MGRPRPLRLDEVRFEYLEANPPNWWRNQTPITQCIHCGRYMDDPTRTATGEPMPEHLLGPEAREAVCWSCSSEAFAQALRADMVQAIDETLGLGETDREAIKAFIETIFTDPKKILQVRDLDNRVRHLERQNSIMWAVIGGVIIALLVAVAALVLTAF